MVLPVVLLPRTSPFRTPDCMPEGISPAWRLTRQLPLGRRRGLGSCCWYHQGDWRKVSRTAIRLLRRVHRRRTGHRPHG
ncbi:hypothetical protein ABZ801_34885 [Actinomadura sp. NPDC047616]|uniref:hypothetical protein n=1 Tax=Actinomadura sp. NPDC047616 TaxID=3155914 RepID=UPI0033C68143